MRCPSAVRSRMPRERWASRASWVRWSVMARIAVDLGKFEDVHSGGVSDDGGLEDLR